LALQDIISGCHILSLKDLSIIR